MARVITLLNETPGHRFDRYHCGDELSEGPTLSVDREPGDGNDYEGILDLVWAIGNRVGTDADGSEWPSTTRSLSAGDVIGVEVSPDRYWWWSIEDIGFRSILSDPRER